MSTKKLQILGSFPEPEVYAAEESVDTSAEVINADTVGGHPASDFAPAGYGLGDSSGKDISGMDLNTILASGWYSFKSDVTNVPENNSIGYSHMLVCARNENFVTQILFQTNADMNVGGMFKRVKYNGAWKPWEYINPPMFEGIEYRTIERYGGYPVYKKVINLGAISANTNIAVKYSNETNCRPIRVGGGTTNGLANQTGHASLISNGTVNATIYGYFGGYLNYITVNYPHSVSEMQVMVEYIKI